MLWAITALTFVATFGILAAVFYAFAPGGTGIATRLSRMANTAAPPAYAGSQLLPKNKRTGCATRWRALGQLGTRRCWTDSANADPADARRLP